MILKVFAVVALTVALQLASHSLLAQDRIVKILTYDIDLRQALGEQDALAIDFDLRYSISQELQTPQGHQFDLSVSATGFRTLADVASDVDHIACEISLGGQYYTSALVSLPAQLQVRSYDLFERDSAGGGPGLSIPEAEELNGLMKRLQQNRRFFTYSLAYRFETTQDFSADQHVLGAGVSAELPLVHRLLDVLPGQTRRSSSQFRPQPVRFYGGLDYVTGLNDTDVGEADDEKDIGRVRLQAAWATHVFDELILRAQWEAQYLFDTPRAFKAQGNEFNSFLQVWAIHPIAGKTGLLVKYINGRLPPNYEEVSGGKVGLNIALQ